MEKGKRVGNPRLVTAAVIIATFLAAIEGTIVSTAIPTIVSDLGGLELISWLVSVYLLTSAVTTPIFGKMADLFGRKLVFMIGTVIFLLGSMLSGLAQSMEQLILFRALQGIGAGGIIPVTYTIIGDLFSFEQRAKIQGWISGVWGISGILGPLTGGLLVDFVSWRWIFYFNVPFGLVSILLIWMYLQENLEKRKNYFDYWGVLTFTIGMTAFIYALLSGGSSYAWDSSVMLSLYAVTLVMLGLFFWIEWKVPEPMLPLKLFTIRFISISNLSSFLISMILVAVTFYIPLWVQGIYGQGATQAGITLIPLSIFWPLGAAVAGRLIVKLTMRKVALAGSFFLFIGSIGLALVQVATPHWLLFPIISILGLGFGLALTSFTVAVQSAVEWNLRGTAMASNTFVRTLGQTLGIAFFGMVFNQQIARYFSGDQGELLKAELDNILVPEIVSTLPDAVLTTMREIFGAGLHSVFFLLTIIAAAAFLITLWLPQRGAEERVKGEE